ncbi:MAG: Gfo/Idh/MocA family oxidoreductase [Protaetiibacter sp.]
MRELKVAIIGGGGFMGYVHSLGWALAPIAAATGASIRKAVLVEADDERAAAAAEKHGWDEYSSDWRAVIARDDIDIVDIVTPPNSHREIALAAIAAGKHVFLEKPITNDAAEAGEMTLAGREAGVVTQVGFNYRHTPAVRYIRKLIDDGTLGRPLQFRVHYLQDLGFVAGDLGWRSKKSTGGSGASGDIGSHIVDLAEYLMGDVARVSSLVRTKRPGADTAWLSDEERIEGELLDDAALWLAEFESGAIGSFATSIFASGRKNRIFFELEATKGTVEFDWNRREEVRLSLTSDPGDQQGFRTVIMGDKHEDIWWPIGGIGTGYIDGTAIQLQKFVGAILSGGDGVPDFASATHVQQVIDAVIASGASHGWVDVPARP